MPTQLEAAPNNVPTALRPGRAGRWREALGLESVRVLRAIRVRNEMKKICRARVGIYLAVTAPISTPNIMEGVIRRTVCQSMALFCAAYMLAVVKHHYGEGCTDGDVGRRGGCRCFAVAMSTRRRDDQRTAAYAEQSCTKPAALPTASRARIISQVHIFSDDFCSEGVFSANAVPP